MSEKRFDDDDYSVVSETHHLRKGMPTVEEVLRAQGRRLTNDELNYMLSVNAIPSIITQDMTPVLHRITRGEEDFYVLMVDEPPCSCRRVGGKKERCDKHKNQRKKVKKDPNCTENRTSTVDVNDITIAFSKTPAYVCSHLPTGTPVLVPINRNGNEKAGRLADVNDFKTNKTIKGILVKGPGDCPQFIPEERVPKKDGLPCFNKYVTGYLTLNDDKMAVFYPETIQTNAGVYPKFEVLNDVTSTSDEYKNFIIADSGMPVIGLKEKKTLCAEKIPMITTMPTSQHFQLPETKDEEQPVQTTPMSSKPSQRSQEKKETNASNARSIYQDKTMQSTYQMPKHYAHQPPSSSNVQQGQNCTTPNRNNLASVYVATPGQNTPRPPPRNRTDDKASDKKDTNINSVYMK